MKPSAKLPSARKQLEYKEIIRFVEAERATRNIAPSTLGIGYRDEPSCFAQGEFQNLVYCQLLLTHEGYGGWTELRDPEIRRETWQFVRRLIRRRKKQEVAS